MKIGIVAGEASGDLLAAGLIQAIKQRYPDARFEGIAGPSMIEAGCEALQPAEKLAVMGLEALAHYRELKGIQTQLVQHFLDNPPDIFIGVDAPDFNLTVERKLKARGIKAVHYVSPSVWAWRQYRVKKIARSVDMILTLFPFEAEFYRQHEVPVKFVGHPLADMIPIKIDVAAARQKFALPKDAAVVALLPGSRVAEVKRLSESLIQTAKLIKEKHRPVHFLVPMATPAVRKLFEQIYAEHGNSPEITIIDGQARDVMTAADVVVLASGTAALEAMLLKKPTVVTYRLSKFGYAIIRRLVKIPYISLPNILAGREIAKELIQDQATPENIAREVLKRLTDTHAAANVNRLYTHIHQQLRQDASNSAAEAVLSLLDDNSTPNGLSENVA